MVRSGLSFSENMSEADKAAQSKATRTSTGAFVTAGEDRTGLINRLEDRIANVLMLDRSSFEAWNVLHYDISQHYYGHHDYFDPGIFPQYAKEPHLQRKYTLLMYLNDVEGGGETSFPWESRDRGGDTGFSYESCDFGIKVRASKGDAIYFEGLSPDHSLDPLSLHAGCPVATGHKWVATKVRRRRFRGACSPRRVRLAVPSHRTSDRCPRRCPFRRRQWIELGKYPKG